MSLYLIYLAREAEYRVKEGEPQSYADMGSNASSSTYKYVVRFIKVRTATAVISPEPSTVTGT